MIMVGVAGMDDETRDAKATFSRNRRNIENILNMMQLCEDLNEGLTVVNPLYAC